MDRLRVIVWSSLVLVAACGGSTQLEPSAVSGLELSTTNPLGNPWTDVEVTVTDPTRAQAIYDATVSLPDSPSGTYNCPEDSGVRYDVTFTSGTTTIMSAVLSPTGCRDVAISGSTTRRAVDETYWASLAQNLGVAKATLEGESTR
ncbi:MAG TPA: hypothetical protein VHJ20_08875 [Polyangia bacterium]|nr:hypothetical protein [Polyangia bacterium]